MGLRTCYHKTGDLCNIEYLKLKDFEKRAGAVRSF